MKSIIKVFITLVLFLNLVHSTKLKTHDKKNKEINEKLLINDYGKY